MLPTLIIPDVHEKGRKADTLFKILLKEGLIERAVFLGDMFDNFGKIFEESAIIYREWIDDPKMQVLVGNHDLNYIFRRGIFACSGYSPLTHEWVLDHVGPLEKIAQDVAKGRLAACTIVHGWLCSHAGVCQMWLDERFDGTPRTIETWNRDLNDQWRSAYANIEMAWAKRQPDGIFDVDEFRGGRQPAGGPFWCHWDLMRDWQVPELRQIVGHTAHPEPTFTVSQRLIDLDTHLDHAGLVYPNGSVKIIGIRGATINPKSLIRDVGEFNKEYVCT